MPGAPNERQRERSASHKRDGADHIRKSFGDKKGGKGNKRQSKEQRKKGQPKWRNVAQEVEQLDLRIMQEVPPTGSLYYKYKAPKEEGKSEAENNGAAATENKALQNKRRNVIETSDKDKIKIRFSDLPLSRCTQSGLFKSKFIKMTEVQRAAIFHAIAGRDVVCSARTGSGKTLSYLIPIVEALYRARWTQFDGLGALILVPTRELAMQAFEVLRSFGGLHDLSAALIIGGKDVEMERTHIATMNIIIATPGRLIQHMDETSGFDGSNLKVLVLDEVDRMLDMGFKQEVDEIVSNLPRAQKLQTLLFSATVTKSMRELARLKLSKNAEFIQIHDFDTIESRVAGDDAGDEDQTEDAKLKSITPTTLLHYYMEVPIQDKLDTLFSFLKTHQKQKILVFFSSRKQVRFAYSAFKSLKVSQNLLELHGKQDQNKRTAIYFQFVEKKHAVLFSTDISARGVDFPAVDWVVQVDCPEDTNTYIHRVGRTARYKSKGNALLMLLPSENKFAEKLKSRSIDMKKLATRADKQLTIQPVLEKLNAENRDLMHLAKKACASYLKGVHVMKDKTVFKLEAIDTQKLAHAHGLLNAPQLTIVAKKEREVDEVVNKKQAAQDRVVRIRNEAKARKLQKQLESAAVASGDDSDEKDDVNDESDEGDFFKKKKRDDKEAAKTQAQDEEEEKKLPSLSKKALRRIKEDGPYAGLNKIKLGGEGQALKKTELFDSDYMQALRKGEALNIDGTAMKFERDLDVQKGSDLQAEHVKLVKDRIGKNLSIDNKVAKEKLKEKRIKVKKRLRAEMGMDDAGDEVGVELPTPEEMSAASDDGQSDDRSVSEEEEEDSSIDEIPLLTKRQKTSTKQTGGALSGATAEEKALKLLNSETFF